MALKDSWNQLRAARQQTVAHRRQQVNLLLQDAHSLRQTNASLLRSDLSLFREMLAVDVASQRQQLQAQNQVRQQDTQAFLAEVRDRRQQQAQDTAQQLSDFVDRLQQQTTEFLVVTGAERQQMAQQLAYDLQTFRTTLTKTVEILRRRLQADIQLLQAEAQVLLEDVHQQRIQMRIQQIETLSQFVAQLQIEVQHYLTQVAIARQYRALEVEDQLAQQQSQRQQQAAAMATRFAEFRAQLHQFVWGAESFEPVSSMPLPEKYLQPELVQQIKGITAEEKIFQYVQSVPEARLTEIESALEMSRYQVIENLRSLIQKGMIVQRNRVYRIADAFSS
jgi:gas vesicle GvpC-like protein